MQKSRVDKLKNSDKLKDLVIIMNELLGKNGCPWDKEQNHKSLIKYLHEEAREVEAAIKKSDWENLKEEEGDIFERKNVNTNDIVDCHLRKNNILLGKC